MKILPAGIISILVQFGLAILGWGGFAAFFSHRPFIIAAVVTLVMGIAAVLSSGNLSAGEREVGMLGCFPEFIEGRRTSCVARR